MEITPTLDLVREHGEILLMLRVIDKICARLEAGSAVEKADLAEVVRFIREYADKCHYGKEERVLFPEVERRDASLKHMIDDLLGEHKSSRDLVDGMDEAASNYEPGGPEAFHFARNAAAYSQLVERHIHKENEVLFKDADALLDAGTKTKMEAEMRKVEMEVLGQGKRDEYVAKLNDLRKTYFKPKA